jgi:hypothetical protein
MEKCNRSLLSSCLANIFMAKLQTSQFKGTFAAFLVSIVFLFGIHFIHADQVSQWEWEGIDRIVAIGDVHGSYDKFVTLLKGTGLVDESLSWIGGEAHLVMVGILWTGAKMIEESLTWSCDYKMKPAQQEDRCTPYWAITTLWFWHMISVMSTKKVMKALPQMKIRQIGKKPGRTSNLHIPGEGSAKQNCEQLLTTLFLQGFLPIKSYSTLMAFLEPGR